MIFRSRAAGFLSDDFSIHLHAPTVSDPSLAPAGHEAFHAWSPVPNLGKRDIDWKAEGPAYADKILSYLESHYLPGLKENLITTRIFTPADFASELNAHLGSAFSFEPVPLQSAYFRTHNRDPRIKGLYFVGAGTHPGAGVPAVINSAKVTAKLTIKDRGNSSPENRIKVMKWKKSPLANPKTGLDWATARDFEE